MSSGTEYSLQPSFNLLFAYVAEHIDSSFISTEDRQFISLASVFPFQLLEKGWVNFLIVIQGNLKRTISTRNP